jgi:hypothetical protein
MAQAGYFPSTRSEPKGLVFDHDEHRLIVVALRRQDVDHAEHPVSPQRDRVAGAQVWNGNVEPRRVGGCPVGELSNPVSGSAWRRLTGRCLAEEGQLILVGDLRAEHPQHPDQLLLFLSLVLGSDCTPKSA